MKAIIFGGGALGHKVFHIIKSEYAEVVFVDNNYTAVDSQHSILPPAALMEMDFDKVFIASLLGIESIQKQLLTELNVPSNKIDRSFSDLARQAEAAKCNEIRDRYLRLFSQYAYSISLPGNIAEVGVYHGDFSKELNKRFPDRQLYLFDTFAGFDRRDISEEANVSKIFTTTEQWMENAGYLADANIQTIISNLPHPENCHIRKGWFPDTFDLAGESFCFVLLDTDLYAPIKAGLELFYPLMVRGGVILVHDYFSFLLEGVASAVNEFVREYNILAMPIGDDCSIAIVKQ